MAKKSLILSIIVLLMFSTIVNASEPIAGNSNDEEFGIKWKCVLGIAEVSMAWVGVGLAVAGTGGMGVAAFAIVGWHMGNISGWLHIGNGCF